MERKLDRFHRPYRNQPPPPLRLKPRGPPPPHPAHRLLLFIIRCFLLGGLILHTAYIIVYDDKALSKTGKNISLGIQSFLQATRIHFGLCVPHAMNIYLLALRHKFKLAILLHFCTLLVAIMALWSHRGSFHMWLKRLLILSAMFQYFRMDVATGEFIPLSQKDFWRLVNNVTIIIGLDFAAYDHMIRGKHHERLQVERHWKREA